MKNWPLRIQITVLVGLVLTLTCLALTVHSIYSAQGYYRALDNETYIDPLPESELVIPDRISPYSIATRQFSVQSLIVMLAAVLCSVALTYWLTGRLLCPLTGLTNSIRTIDQGKLNQRVKPGRAAGEIRELAESFNGMLARLEESFEIQKNFAANAAHELKTPLAVLKTSLQVLEMDMEPQPEDYREFTAAAKASIERLTGTVDALMILAQGGVDKSSAKVDLSALVELIFSEQESRAQALGVSLSLSGSCLPLSGNPTLVYRALYNLIENAIKYNQPGGRVSVTLSQKGERARIQVADNGTGMSKETASHAFEPFYRADRSRSQKIPGSGLGLSVVKTIVEQHHGQIHLESAEGAGTNVIIIL